MHPRDVASIWLFPQRPLRLIEGFLMPLSLLPVLSTGSVTPHCTISAAAALYSLGGSFFGLHALWHPKLPFLDDR
jgi:hypothetical protein